jgi:hypothetical protein
MMDYFDIAAVQWIATKDAIVRLLDLSNDSLHVHGALILLFGSAIVIRRRPDNLFSWLIVLAAEVFNEYADLRGVAPGEDSIAAGLHDLYNTMFWPTMILLFGGLLFPRKAKDIPKPAVSLSEDADQSLEQTPAV